MSVSRRLLFGGLMMLCSLVLAADDDIPNMEFLEYLGMWESSDEDWLIFNDAGSAEKDKRSDPAPQGKESTENDDEN